MFRKPNVLEEYFFRSLVVVIEMLFYAGLYMIYKNRQSCIQEDYVYRYGKGKKGRMWI